MLLPVTQIAGNTHIRRVQVLPLPGRVHVKPGQRVRATDVIAETFNYGKHHLLDIRKTLGIPMLDDASLRINIHVGESVEKGQVIAQTGGFIPKTLRSPVTGYIAAIQRGQILIETAGDKIDLQAGINGMVMEVFDEYGAAIEGNGAYIQGVWGNGKIGIGPLRMICRDFFEELTPEQITVDLAGSIAVGGYLARPEALASAAKAQVAGLILAGMCSSVMEDATKASFPILLVEGFGHLSMNILSLKLLLNHEGDEAVLNAQILPEINKKADLMIPQREPAQPGLLAMPMKKGQIAKIIAPPYSGTVGLIEQVNFSSTEFEEGYRSPTAALKIDESNTLTVPLSNLMLVDYLLE
ncbi:MAG TPA: hypothetical protein PKD55_02045 [Bellilinea sp.]|nr:hypothetical protein [Bellilinea sp.]